MCIKRVYVSIFNLTPSKLFYQETLHPLSMPVLSEAEGWRGVATTPIVGVWLG